MKSITQCPHCETQFYVDDKQLSQFNGKVRCGHCLEVFMASDYFVDQLHKQPTPKIVVPTPEVVNEINIDDLPEDTAAIETQLEARKDFVEEKIEQNPAASFAFKNDETFSVEEEINQSGATEDELDGLTSVRDIDENFIAKTESLIKNIDIEDAAHKLDSQQPLDDEPAEKGLNEEPDFSFKIDSPETLDVLTKWREEADKDLDDIQISKSEESENVVQSNDATSIDAPPTPMTDEFVLPEPGNITQENSESYDFLLTEKEPFSPWMLVLAITLVLLLLGQGLYHFRNEIARSVPELKPFLQQLCVPIGCKISLPKEINLLSIDDSGIQQDANLQGVIRLSTTITNRAKFSQAYPKLEVTLTDERDMPKLRRVFSPKDYLSKQANLTDGIQAGESIPVEMALMTEAENISGFRILLAY